MKNRQKWVTVGVVALVLVFAVTLTGRAQQHNRVAELTELANALDGNINAYEMSLEFLGSLGEDLFSASGTRFPNGISADSTSPVAGQVRGTIMSITGTTTVQEISYGSRYSSSLTFTAGATTTPGGLFSLQNIGAPKTCRHVELDITTAGAKPLDFSISSSTAASSFNNGGTALIATTTAGTSTTPLLNDTDHAGTADMASWDWESDVYLLGTFDLAAGAPTSTSGDYTGMEGNVYFTCRTK